MLFRSLTLQSEAYGMSDTPLEAYRHLTEEMNRTDLPAFTLVELVVLQVAQIRFLRYALLKEGV